VTAGITFALPTLNRGGAERVVVSLARMLALANFDVSLVVLKGANALREDLPTEVRVIVLDTGRSAFCIPELAQAFRRLSPDLIVATTHHMNVATVIAARLAGIKNVALRCPNTPSAEGDLGGLTALAARWAYRRSRHVIAQTEEMKADLVARFDVDPCRVWVLQNPVDTALMDQKLAGAANPYDPRKTNVLTAGRLSRQKGVDILICSFAAAVKREPRLRLHVLGRDGGEERNLRKLAEGLELGEHVVFWGEQENPYPFLKYCDLFVLASRWEGMPNVILECIYLNRPIVATRTVPAIERLIDQGRNALLVPVDDAAALTEAILAKDSLIADHRPLPAQDVASFFADLASGKNN
jgi:glycosyltransferase involved in cell wall biosynthesis